MRGREAERARAKKTSWGTSPTTFGLQSAVAPSRHARESSAALVGRQRGKRSIGSPKGCLQGGPRAQRGQPQPFSLGKRCKELPASQGAAPPATPQSGSRPQPRPRREGRGGRNDSAAQGTASLSAWHLGPDLAQTGAYGYAFSALHSCWHELLDVNKMLLLLSTEKRVSQGYKQNKFIEFPRV